MIDLLTLPVAALWQQKLRTSLTTLGVVFGAFVLAASLSIGKGVQETIERESRRVEVARRVEVRPSYEVPRAKLSRDDVTVDGTMSDARRERLRTALATSKRALEQSAEPVSLTRTHLKEIAAIPHVRVLVPVVNQNGHALLGARSEPVHVSSVRPEEPMFRRLLVAGRFFDAPDQRGLVLSEFLAYKLGARDDADVERLIGRPVRLELRDQDTAAGIGVFLWTPGRGNTRLEAAAMDRLRAHLPNALESAGLDGPQAEVLRAAIREGRSRKPLVHAEEFPVIGVVRWPTGEELGDHWDVLRSPGDVLLPYQAAASLYFRRPGHGERGLFTAVAIVDSEENVRAVVDRLKQLGFAAYAPLEFIDRQRLIYVLIFSGMTCVAAIALLVSALGIANTMLMSVLERTREIGVMKAVGAADSHLMWVFLLEGALIGVAGGGLGLLLAWGASFPGDAWVQSMIRRDLHLKMPGSIFVFPPWVAATVMVFTVVITTLAALYPARHATRVDPVKALRHE